GPRGAKLVERSPGLGRSVVPRRLRARPGGAAHFAAVFPLPYGLDELMIVVRRRRESRPPAKSRIAGWSPNGQPAFCCADQGLPSNRRPRCERGCLKPANLPSRHVGLLRSG